MRLLLPGMLALSAASSSSSQGTRLLQQAPQQAAHQVAFWGLLLRPVGIRVIQSLAFVKSLLQRRGIRVWCRSTWRPFKEHG